MSFIHLNLHSEFSLNDSIINLKNLFYELKNQEAKAVALTDFGNAFGWIKFYKEALKSGIKPIFGADVILLTEEGTTGKLTLLAQNYQGYLNLSIILSNGYRFKQIRNIPHITPEWLNEYSEGLIAILPKESHLGHALLHQSEEIAHQILETYFLPYIHDRLYLGIKRLGHDNDELFIQHVLKFADRHSLPIVALNDVRFMKSADFSAHEVRTCIQSGHVINDKNRPKAYRPEQYLKSAHEMTELFKDIPEAIINSLELSKRCTVELSLGKPKLPHIPPPEGMTVDQFFRHEAEKGLVDRIGAEKHQYEKYWQRLETELDVIIGMGFPDYFLIVADFIQWSKDNAIPVGPGRGSGAGSLVAWALKITDLDPLPYDLLFERFLNPERVSMPDFDIDFCMEGRDKVIEYVAQKYGRESVSQIATHGTMAAKAVVRDVGRALGHPYGFVDNIAKLIPFELGITLEKALMQEPELYDLYHNDDEVKILIDYAKQLEGLTKSVGRHAGGVVISPTLLTDFSPLYCEEASAVLVTQYDKDDVEAAGLVKFDFLGLRTLTIIDWTLKNISLNREISLDINSLPLDDHATYNLLKTCQTTAVFQLESRGMKDLLRRLQPDTFEDIIALVALFRPGPLESGMVEDFINRKHGLEEVDYPFPELESVLSPTYGVIVYQEQVMQISQIIGNYTLGGADILRRAMGKKLPEEMDEQRILFMDGAKTLGFDADKAGRLFDLMEKFAGYGFNKSHSAAYALLSYQTAYLKHHYPTEFMAAVLSSDLDNTDKVVISVEECKQMKRVIRRPNVNESHYQFTVAGEEIIYGLGALKGYGKAASLQLINERETHGHYQDLFDFCRRIDLSKTTRRSIEILIRSGSLDSFNPDLNTTIQRAAYRADLLATLEKALQLANQHHANLSSGQDDLFGLFAEPSTINEASIQPLNKGIPLTEKELLQLEKETLGFYFTAHPIDQYQQEIGEMITHSLGNILSQPEPPYKTYKNNSSDSPITTAGLVTQVRSMYSKNGNKMLFLTLEDKFNRMEVRIFDEHIDNLPVPLTSDMIVFLKGSLNWDNFSNEMRIRVNSLHTLDMMRNEYAKYFYLMNTEQITVAEIQAITELLQNYHNDEKGIPVVFHYSTDYGSTTLKLGGQFSIQPNSDLITELYSQYYPRIKTKFGYQVNG